MSIFDWHPRIKNLTKSQSMQDLKAFLQAQKQAKKVIFPPTENWFSAFELTKFDQVKIVILGQDPYHGKNQAQGLSFSVPIGIKIPPSLKNIFQELKNDLNIVPSQHGNLSAWAEQGVLLLNSVLTVEANHANSHANRGWEEFTDGVIKILNEEKQHLIFMLWGAYAQKKIALIDANKHLVLSTAHPSPFSAHKGFFGCKHFSQANHYLTTHQQSSISWQLL